MKGNRNSKMSWKKIFACIKRLHLRCHLLIRKENHLHKSPKSKASSLQLGFSAVPKDSLSC